MGKFSVGKKPASPSGNLEEVWYGWICGLSHNKSRIEERDSLSACMLVVVKMNAESVNSLSSWIPTVDAS